MCQPPWPEWPGLATSGRASTESWPAALARRRADAQHEVVGGSNAPIVMTGHQPPVIHPGIWIRLLAIDQLARQGLRALELVVYTDHAVAVELRLPSLRPPDVETIGLAPVAAARRLARERVANDRELAFFLWTADEIRGLLR